MKRRFNFTWIVFFLFGFIFNILANTSRNTYNFNPQWKVFVGDPENAMKSDFDDSGWQSVTLPYAWNQKEAFCKDIVDLSTGIAWYRKHFKLNKKDKNKKVFIEFEGVRQAAEVYINGHYLGIHENGITAFGYDLTDYVLFGKKENIIAVRTDNHWDYKEKATGSTFQWSNRNFNVNYGGIPKNVKLHLTGQVYQTLPLYTDLKTTGQYIYATDINIPNRTAFIHAETEVKNETNEQVSVLLEVEVEDLDGKIVHQMQGKETIIPSGSSQILEASGLMKDIHFWSWGYGYLYNVHTILKKDGKIIEKVSTRTGFRKTEFSDGLIKLNDKIIMIKGYAQRTSNEWPAAGISIPPWMSDYSNKMMIESNANTVRWMHITPSRQDVESCDRVGLIQALPAGDAERDVEGRQWEQRVEVMRDAIIYNRNNPSVIFYESGNKGISEDHMQEMKDLRDQYDPHGGRAAGCREMLDSEVAEYGGEMLYINKSDDMPVWAMEYMRDEALRKYWDEYTWPFHKDGDGPDYKGRDGSAYNRNQDSHAIEAVKRWYDYYRERPGTGKRMSSGGVNIIFSDTNTHHRGTENYRRSGEVDALRIPKDAFYAHQIIWDGWIEPKEHRTHIVGHWNYKPDIVKDIYVISTGEEVELFVNGKSKGSGNREYEFLFTFENIQWKTGEIKAVARDAEGNVVSEDQIQTAGDPESIRLTLHTSPAGIKADGADMAFVDVEVVDKNGLRCPTSFDTIQFALEGKGEWLGGLAQGPDNFILSKSLPVECGVNRVLIRSLTSPGKINLSASCEGLQSASVTFKTHPVKVKNGMSISMPDAELPVNLQFGPTPAATSIKPSRISVEIISARAGANQDDAALSFDGKQSTRWMNDGNIETGWIEYQLEKETLVSEIALKLSGWRTRRYPIVVTANDSILYQGITDPNLGYYYIIPDHPVKTDNLKIRLFGKTEFQDTYQLVEITGKLDRETAEDLSVQNHQSLNIVEIEVFEKP